MFGTLATGRITPRDLQMTPIDQEPCKSNIPYFEYPKLVTVELLMRFKVEQFELRADVYDGCIHTALDNLNQEITRVDVGADGDITTRFVFNSTIVCPLCGNAYVDPVDYVGHRITHLKLADRNAFEFQGSLSGRNKYLIIKELLAAEDTTFFLTYDYYTKKMLQIPINSELAVYFLVGRDVPDVNDQFDKRYGWHNRPFYVYNTKMGYIENVMDLDIFPASQEPMVFKPNISEDMEIDDPSISPGGPKTPPLEDLPPEPAVVPVRQEAPKPLMYWPYGQCQNYINPNYFVYPNHMFREI